MHCYRRQTIQYVQENGICMGDTEEEEIDEFVTLQQFEN
jgi:hypothetical protein